MTSAVSPPPPAAGAPPEPAQVAAGSSDSGRDDLTRKTVRGVGWTAGAQIGRQVASTVLSVVIARLLLPAEFGQMSQVLVLSGLANLFADFGLGSALVQRREVEERHLSSVFWVQLGLGVAMAGLAVATAPLVARFYDDDALAGITLAIAPYFVLSALCTVQRALLIRDMRFRTNAMIEVAAVASGGVLCAVTAALGAGAYALVTQQLTFVAVTLALLWGAARWRPSARFDRTAISELLPFSGNLFGYTIFNYAIRHGDNLLVGRLMGATALGLYTRGYAILLYPTRQVTAVVGKVMFASLSRISHDVPRLRRGYLRAISIIALITFPMMIGLALVSSEFVRVLLGPRWEAAIPIIRIFCVLGAAESLMATVGWIYQSTGRTDVLFRWTLVLGPVPLAGIAVGAALGEIETVTIGYAATTVALLYPSFRIAGKLIDMTFTDVVRAVSPVAMVTALMAGAVALTGLLLPAGTASIVSLVVKAAVGAVVYLTAVVVLRIAPYVELRSILLEREAGHLQPEARIWHDPVLQLKLQQLRERRDAGAVGGVLFAGTSQVLEGIDPAVAAPGFGLRAYNGALHRGTMSLTERVLPELMLPLVRPKLVVVGLSVIELNRNTTIRTDSVARYESCPAKRGVRGRVRRAVHERSVLFRRLSAKLPGENVTLGKLKIRGDGSGTEFATATEYWMSDRKRAYVESDLVVDYELGPEPIEELERCITRIRAAGAAVVLVDMPMTDDLTAMLPRGHADLADYRDALAEVAARHQVRLLDQLRALDDHRWYADPLHFNGAGMAAASAIVAEQLAAELDAIR